MVAAIQEQAARLIFYSNIVYNDVRAHYAATLMAVAPEGFGQVFFCNSGAEANETALKLSRKFTGRPTIIAMEGAFHGRTMGALAMTSNPKYKAGLRAAAARRGVRALRRPGRALAAMMSEQVAAVILEPIQSIAGVRMADAAYYQGLRELCDKCGALLIFDEIQTGLGRTGKLWVGEHWGVTPDIITLAKGIASGVPMGATLVSSRIAATVHLDEHGSTFGGGPLACAAAAATLDVILGDDLPAHAAAMGELHQEQSWAACPTCARCAAWACCSASSSTCPPRTCRAPRWSRASSSAPRATPMCCASCRPWWSPQADVEHLVTVLGEVLRGRCKL